MRYTITAFSPSEKNIEVMRMNLLAVGAPRDAITIDPGHPGTSQPQIKVRTDNLDASQSYQETLELAGGMHVAMHEESSALNAIKVPNPSRRNEPSDATAEISPSAKIWQDQGRWFVQLQSLSTAMSFATQDEAIAYSMSVYSDGRSAARAETQRGDLPLHGSR